MKKQSVLLLTLILGLILTAPVQACSVCFGNSDDPIVHAVAAGVLFLAGVIYSVLLSIVVFAVVYLRRASRLPEAGGSLSQPTT